jgi:hypothetical protein
MKIGVELGARRGAFQRHHRGAEHSESTGADWTSSLEAQSDKWGYGKFEPPLTSSTVGRSLDSCNLSLCRAS